MKAHCLFEQSGTFKNAFKSFGIDAEDYDILNDFGETDHVIDLFNEIDKAYDGKPSIFDNIAQDDIILAFFPCTRFECQVSILFRGEGKQQINYTDLEKIEYAMKLHEELHELYTLLCKMFVVCYRGGRRLVVENPATEPHYLARYFPVKPKLIDNDRRKNGDRQKKPSQYWFVNIEPQQNFCMIPLEAVEERRHVDIGGKDKQRTRSMIHPQYARRFIAQYILEVDGNVVTEDYRTNDRRERGSI